MVTSSGGQGERDRTAAGTHVDALVVAVLVGAAAGWVAATNSDVSGLAVLGVILGAAVLLGGLLAVPSALT